MTETIFPRIPAPRRAPPHLDPAPVLALRGEDLAGAALPHRCSRHGPNEEVLALGCSERGDRRL